MKNKTKVAKSMSIGVIAIIIVGLQISYAQLGFTQDVYSEDKERKKGGITLFGSINMAKISWENLPDEFGETKENYLMGYRFGVEKAFGGLIIGSTYTQRGEVLEIDWSVSEEGFSITMDADMTFTLNYVTAYMLYPLEVSSGLSVFGGLEGGYFLSGTTKAEGKTTISGDGMDESESFDEEEDIEKDDVALDYGILVGADYWVNKKLGIRGSYYYGLAKINSDDDEDDDKHKGIQVTLLYKLK